MSTDYSLHHKLDLKLHEHSNKFDLEFSEKEDVEYIEVSDLSPNDVFEIATNMLRVLTYWFHAPTKEEIFNLEIWIKDLKENSLRSENERPR